MGVKNFLRHQAKTKALTLRRLIVTLRPLRRPGIEHAKCTMGGNVRPGPPPYLLLTYIPT